MTNVCVINPENDGCAEILPNPLGELTLLPTLETTFSIFGYTAIINGPHSLALQRCQGMPWNRSTSQVFVIISHRFFIFDVTFQRTFIVFACE